MLDSKDQKRTAIVWAGMKKAALGSRLKREEEIGRARGSGRSGENRFCVHAQRAEPVGDIIGVILAGFDRDREIGAEIGCSQLGNEFLHRIGAFIEAALQVTIETAGMGCPMGQLVKEGRIIGFGRVRRLRTEKTIPLRHLDMIGGRPIEGAWTAVKDLGAGRGDEVLDGFDAFGEIAACRLLRQREAIDLVGVEDGGRFGNEDGARFRFAGVGIDAVDIEVLVEYDERGFLALAHLGAEFGPLAVGAPDAAGVIAKLGRDPKRQDIDATVGFARQGIYGTAETGPGPMPGHLKLAGPGFDSGDDLLSDLAVDVAFGFHNLLLSCRQRGVAHGREEGGWQRGAPHRQAAALAEEGLPLRCSGHPPKQAGKEQSCTGEGRGAQEIRAVMASAESGRSVASEAGKAPVALAERFLRARPAEAVRGDAVQEIND